MYNELQATQNWWHRLTIKQRCDKGEKRKIGGKGTKKEITGKNKRESQWRAEVGPHTRVSMRGANGSGARVASNFSLLSSEMTLQI